MQYPRIPSGSLSLVSRREPSLSVFDYQKLCNVLAGYKFAELLVLRENVGNRVSKSVAVKDIYLPPSSTNARLIPHVCPFALPEFHNLTLSVQAYERLHHWPSVLDRFQTAVGKSISLAPQIDIPDGSSRLLILMRLLVRNEQKSNYLNIENNFLYAALHVYALNMGIFPQGVIPNFPGEQKNVQMSVISFGLWYTSLTFPISKFTDQVSQQEYAEATALLLDQHDIHSSGGNTGHASLCAPLHLALLISPIYLLLPFRIIKQSFH